jgi:tRNA G37 N-methylase Trm5
MVIASDTHIGRWIEETGRLDHDQYLLPKIVPLIPEGGTVVDAGALYGDHTLAYAKAVGPYGEVFAFEPNPQSYTCLKKNMETFGVSSRVV